MQPIIGEDLEEQIRRRAYEIWEESGRPEGMESEHWEQAAREIAASAVDPPSGADNGGAAGTPQQPQAAQRAAKAVGARQGSRRSAKPD